MTKPKKMTAQRYAMLGPRCILCQKAVCPGDFYHTSKTKNRRLRYIHALCWAQVKKVNT